MVLMRRGKIWRRSWNDAIRSWQHLFKTKQDFSKTRQNLKFSHFFPWHLYCQIWTLKTRNKNFFQNLALSFFGHSQIFCFRRELFFKRFLISINFCATAIFAHFWHYFFTTEPRASQIKPLYVFYVSKRAFLRLFLTSKSDKLPSSLFIHQHFIASKYKEAVRRRLAQAGVGKVELI